MRPLPNLFIAGVGKAGTTALHDYLNRRPDVLMSSLKEPNYFGRDLHFRGKRRSLDNYLEFFRDGGEKTYRGESSIINMLSKTAAGEIAAFNPDAKVIIILRHPVDVMHSRHAQNVKRGHEDTTDFLDALAKEPARRQGRMMPPTCPVQEYVWYREWVQYTDRLERYFEAFPRDQVFVGLYDELRSSPDDFVGRICAFLELPFLPELKLRSVNANKSVASHRLNRLLRWPPDSVRRLARITLPRRELRERLRNQLLDMLLISKPRVKLDDVTRQQLVCEFHDDLKRTQALTDLGTERWLCA